MNQSLTRSSNQPLTFSNAERLDCEVRLRLHYTPRSVRAALEAENPERLQGAALHRQLLHLSDEELQSGSTRRRHVRAASATCRQVPELNSRQPTI